MLKKAVSLATVLCLLLSGCWDAKDINDQNIVTTILLDKVLDRYVFYIEIANTDSSGKSSGEGGGSGGGDNYVIVKAEGSSIVEARNALERKLDQPLFLGATRALILTDNLASYDVSEYFNRIRADIRYRKKVLTVTTSCVPEEIFKISENSSESTGFYIEEMLKSLVAWGNTFIRPTSRLIENTSSRYSSFVIPKVKVSDNTIELAGYTVMLHSKAVGTIPVEESKGLVYLKNNKARWDYQIPYGGSEYATEIRLAGKKIKPHYDNGEISFDLDLKFDAEIFYSNVRLPLVVDEKTISGLKEEITKILKDEIDSTIYKSQHVFNSDYLSFEDEFHIAYPSEYHKINWYEEYKNARVNTKIKLKLRVQDIMDYEPYDYE